MNILKNMVIFAILSLSVELIDRLNNLISSKTKSYAFGFTSLNPYPKRVKKAETSTEKNNEPQKETNDEKKAEPPKKEL